MTDDEIEDLWWGWIDGDARNILDVNLPHAAFKAGVRAGLEATERSTATDPAGVTSKGRRCSPVCVDPDATAQRAGPVPRGWDRAGASVADSSRL